MLNLTVLQRYRKGRRRIVKTLAIITIDFENNEIMGIKENGVFSTKYSDQKEKICKLFTSNKSFERIFKEIEESGMKIAKVNVLSEENAGIAILIED